MVRDGDEEVRDDPRRQRRVPSWYVSGAPSPRWSNDRCARSVGDGRRLRGGRHLEAGRRTAARGEEASAPAEPALARTTPPMATTSCRTIARPARCPTGRSLPILCVEIETLEDPQQGPTAMPGPVSATHSVERLGTKGRVPPAGVSRSAFYEVRGDLEEAVVVGLDQACRPRRRGRRRTATQPPMPPHGLACDLREVDRFGADGELTPCIRVRSSRSRTSRSRRLASIRITRAASSRSNAPSARPRRSRRIAVSGVFSLADRDRNARPRGRRRAAPSSR